MLKDETKRKLRLMNIGEFVEAIELQSQDPASISLPFDERMDRLTDTVYQAKYNERVQRLLKSAKLRFPKADVHDIFYAEDRGLNRTTINELATCSFVEENRSVIFQGYTSSGKTYLGCTRYIRLPDLLMEFDEKSIEPGGKDKVLTKYSNFRVLIIDEWLISDVSYAELEFLFELSERRFDSTSTIFCTLYRGEDWIQRLGGGAYAESIYERYRHGAIVIETGDMNMRSVFNAHR